LAAAGLDKNLLLLNSGQSYDLETGKKDPDTPYYLHTEEELKEYIKELETKKYDHEKVDMRDNVPIERMFTMARNKLWTMQEKKKNYPDTTLYFHITNQNRTFKLDYRKPDAAEVAPGTALEEPRIELSMNSTLFAMALINHVSWNMADQLIDYNRVPNIYNHQAYVLLNHLTI
jgi:hypothetical protein